MEDTAKPIKDTQPTLLSAPTEMKSLPAGLTRSRAPLQTALAFMAGLLVGWFLGPALAHDKNDALVGPGFAPIATKEETPQRQVTFDGTLSVPEEQEAGTTVLVSNLASSHPIWAVVYENIDGTPARVLGAARFFPGESQGRIELLRMTLPNLRYFVGLVEDTQNHQFSVHINKPVLGEDGKQVMVSFTAR